MFSCGPHLPADYVEHSSDARDAYARGDYRGAARHWDAAHAAAPNKRYRDEALYRRAVSLQRAGRDNEARAIFERLAGAQGARQARAAFDAARALIAAGDEEQGYVQLRQALLAHPNSGPAVRAARDLLDRAAELEGDAERLRLTRELESRLRETELHQLLAYTEAQTLRRMGQRHEALDAYRRVIGAYPYPLGRYWDESIIASAELLRDDGRAQHAVQLLRWQLQHRESADFVGSYERHYAKAHFLLATITRDQLGNLASARDEFRTLERRYERSLLRDDALWQAVLCSLELGQPDQACVDAHRLLDEHPQSRYAPCVHHVCRELAASGECHDYVLPHSSANGSSPTP